MIAAIMTKMTPPNRTIKEAFFFQLRFTFQRSCWSTCEQSRTEKEFGRRHTGTGIDNKYKSVMTSGIRTERTYNLELVG